MTKIQKIKKNMENNIEENKNKNSIDNIEKKFDIIQNKSSDKSKDSDKMKKKRDFSEKVIKFIQYDDLIKETMIEHRKQINELKTQKKELELFLIDYLDEINNDIINCGESDVIKKVEKQKKAPLNKTLMKKSIIEDMIKEKFIKTEEQGEKIIEKMFENMENKRAVTNVVELKRKSIKQKK
jgi:hypothetical protein